MKVFVGALIMLLAVMRLEGQEYTIDLKELPAGKLTLTPASTAHVDAFDSVFKVRDFARMQPYALVLRNQSEKPLIGLSVRWILQDSSGAQHTVTYSSDSLFLVYSPIALAGENLLVTPSFLLPESLAGSGFTSSEGSTSGLANDFQQSRSIVASIDVAIFADGEVIGPDRGRMVENIRARKAVAESIASEIQTLLDRGTDPTAKLEELKTLPPSSKTDASIVWTNRIANLLLRSQDKNTTLGHLKALPTPDFHRQ